MGAWPHAPIAWSIYLQNIHHLDYISDEYMLDTHQSRQDSKWNTMHVGKNLSSGDRTLIKI